MALLPNPCDLDLCIYKPELSSVNPSTDLDLDLRIYKPKLSSVNPSTEEDSKYRSYLRRKIRASYRKARKRLACCSSEQQVSVQGLCIGLLDPVSNIVINSVLFHCKRERVRVRDYKHLPREDLECRSLDGLVVFLTRLFPNISELLAVHYLYLAKADVLIAVRMLVSDHFIKSFDGSWAALLDMSLKCAGRAAKCPDPDHLVYAWRNISGRINRALSLLESMRQQSPGRPCHIIRELRLMFNEGESLITQQAVWHAWELAYKSPCSLLRRSARDRRTHLLVRTLEDTIHGYYLKALARLPAGSGFHRSLIRAGHCYGPLDPVSNIIINTIWYHASFPPSMKLELNVIGTRSLHRIENRSLYGMASFLSTHHHAFDFHGAVRGLLEADANLMLAVSYCDDIVPIPSHTGVSYCDAFDGHKQAFLAAATAACHPNPDAQVKLLIWCKDMLGSALSLLHPDSDKLLSSQDVERLARLLSPGSTYYYDCERALPPLPLKSYPCVDLADLFTVASKGVNAVLNKYQHMTNGDKYELHTICGVNHRVGGPVQWPPHNPGHCHVNFLATPKSSCGGDLPTLFFAEIHNNGTYNSFCCPVSLPPACAAQIRCAYCEATGTRIVHPAGIDFCGRESEFENMACEEDPCMRKGTTLRIINHRDIMANNVRGKLKEDFLYDGLDGQKSKFDDTSSLSMEEAMLLMPVCRFY